ncbi:aminoglycoside phosphotransferase family protein [Bacillus manliponensis]|uniref:aminoglycoside phosphotransferase family protein n=1 Tax=Bacillus manliponensis TaxID=574376 RepID=UPI0035124E47
MTNIPSSLIKTIQDIHDKQGETWIAKFSNTIQTLEQKLALKVTQPFKNLSYNYVVLSENKQGEQFVLKLGVPSLEFKHEIEALLYSQGDGVVKLLDYDENVGFLLLQHVTPGDSLAQLEDETKATKIMAKAMKSFWREVPMHHQFPSIENWANGLQNIRKHFHGGTGPLPEQLVKKAERLFPELITTISKPIFIHGDLHHDNVLRMENNQYIVIDPKGLIGEAEYEVVAYLRNHLLNKQDPKAVLENRINILVEELQLDKERVVRWGLSHCILSAWWYVESHGRVQEETIACAQFFDELLV